MHKPFHQLDLNLLRLLLALQRTRSVTLAGQALALSQPAASNALARLRLHFDDPLYVRSSSGLLPTPRAEQLALAAEPWLQSLQSACSAAQGFEPAHSTRSWRLSLSDLGEMVFLPDISRAVLGQAPHTRIVNAAVATPQLGQALAQGEVDLAIGILDARQRGLRHVPLFSETYVGLSDPALVPRQRNRAGLARVGLVVAAPTATFHGGVEASLKRAGLGDQVVMRTRHFAAMPDLVRSAPLVGVVPASWAQVVCQRHGLLAWPLPVALPDYEVRLVWHQAGATDPAVAWLREVVQGLFQRPG